MFLLYLCDPPGGRKSQWKFLKPDYSLVPIFPPLELQGDVMGGRGWLWWQRAFLLRFSTLHHLPGFPFPASDRGTGGAPRHRALKLNSPFLEPSSPSCLHSLRSLRTYLALDNVLTTHAPPNASRPAPKRPCPTGPSGPVPVLRPRLAENTAIELPTGHRSPRSHRQLPVHQKMTKAGPAAHLRLLRLRLLLL